MTLPKDDATPTQQDRDEARAIPVWDRDPGVLHAEIAEAIARARAAGAEAMRSRCEQLATGCECDDLARAIRSLPADATEPEQFNCPTCGPRVAADEDGCCVTCGADCVVSPADASEGGSQ